MSRAVQVFMLGLLFVFVAAGCVAFLVLSGGVDPTGSRIIFVAGALVLLSGLAAAVSALGPKYRPSPFLTPLTAGVFAALIATTAVVSAGHSQNATKGKAPAARVAERRVPPVAQPKPKVPEAPVVQAAVAQPVVAAPPAPPPQKPVRVLDGSLDPAAVQAAAVQKIDPAPLLAPKPVALAAPEPAAAKVAAVQEPAKAAAPVAASEAASTAAKKPVAIAAIPNPKLAPPLPAADSGAPISLQTSFDTTTPAAKSAGQPLSLAAAASQSGQAAAAIPPLPRIRPCGAGGPACP
jgi:hypothetical protein